MIYDRNNIVDNYRGLIGFVPTHDSSNFAAKIADSLKMSYSGQYINNLHPYFTAEIFSNVADHFAEFTVQAWSSSVAYNKGDVVSAGSLYYESTQSSTNQPPATATDYWKRTTLLSIWIQNKYDGAVLSTIDALMEANKLEYHGKGLRGVTPLFDQEGVKTNTISKVAGRFVGYEIGVVQPNVSVTLQRIGMQITGSKQVPIYVRYNGEETQINGLTFTGNSRFNYQDIEPITFFGGMGPIEIGYYEDDLGSESAIGLASGTFAQTPCYTCGGVNTGYRTSWEKWISVTPISIQDEDVTDNFDTNYGLNLALSFRCDLSDILIREKISVVPALKAMLKVVFLEALAANTRNNQEADQVTILAYNQLNAYQDPYSPKNELKRAIKALQFEMSNINPACMPCEQTFRIRNRVI